VSDISADKNVRAVTQATESMQQQSKELFPSSLVVLELPWGIMCSNELTWGLVAFQDIHLACK